MARFNRRKPEVQQLDDRTVPAVLDPVPVVDPLAQQNAIPQVASVTGTVFADLDSSGTQGANEPGLAGVQVVLRDANGVAKGGVVTATDGSFSFANVADGLVTVVASPTAGGPNSSDIVRALSVSGGVSPAPLALGVQSNGSVSGSAFADTNGTGRRDTGEAGVAGATVVLDLYGTGKSPLTTTTAADGSYKFTGVPDGAHRLTVTGTAAQGGTYGPITVSVVGGANATAVDAPFRPTSAVSGTITLGTVATGVGLPGLTVSLDINSDSKIDATTTTDASGNYLFAGVPAGTHVVSVTAPGAASFDTPDKTGRLLVSTTGTVKSGQNIGVTYSGKVVGTTFIDSAGDGKYSSADTPIVPQTVQVDLFNSGKVISVPATSLNGSYVLSNIPDGTHTVIATVPGGYSATTAVRDQVTVTNGGTATVDAVGYRPAAGATVAVGNGDLAGATTYTFTKAADGTLTALQGNVTTPAGKSTNTRAVTADVNGDGVDDLITAGGSGGSPVVRIFDGKTNQELVPDGIMVFEAGFLGGLNLATGDFLKTGKPQIVVSADVGGGPRVKIIDPTQYMTGADPAKSKVVADFFGIEDEDFRGGTRTAVGDMNGDGVPDLVVAAGQGGGPRVAVYDGRTVGGGASPVRLVNDFFAFESTLRNGATVAVGDLNASGSNDLIVGAGPGGSPRVVVFDGTGVLANKGAESTRLADFYVNNDTSSRSGTRLTAKDVDGDGKADIVATNGARAYVFTGTSILATYLTGTTPTAATVLNPFPQVVRGGLFVG